MRGVHRTSSTTQTPQPPAPVIAEHAAAPDFTVKTDEGKELRLSCTRGARTVVLYFYPKDDTPGCTVEACELRDAFPRFHEDQRRDSGREPGQRGVAPEVQEEIRAAVHAAGGHRPCASPSAYGVWVEKSMYGKKYWGVQRATFMIDKKGRWPRCFPK